MSNKRITRSRAKMSAENLQDKVDSIHESSRSHKDKSCGSNAVIEELIKAQEEETNIIMSCARAKAAAERAEAKAAAERAEAKAAAERAEAAQRMAAADIRLSQVEEQAKLKEIAMKKKLLEDRLTSLSKRSSETSSRSSRCSIHLPQPMPVKEAVEKWMQAKQQADNIYEGNVSKHFINFPGNPMKKVQQGMALPDNEVQPGFWPREENGVFPRDARPVSSNEGKGKRNPREDSFYPPFYPHQFQSFRDRMPARVLSALPNFSGDLEQWPAWIAEYRRSSNDYTDLENLQRLQKSISGKAKDIISALLIYPENVPEIINLLDRRFGRPEIIIKSLIAGVKNRPPTKDYKPDTLVDFSDMVRNLVVTVKSLKQDHYLFNPQLLEELTEKLSTNMKLNWGMFITSQQSGSRQPIGIDSFSLWLSSIAEAATCVSSLPSLPGISYKNVTRNQSEQKNFTFMHVDNDRTKFCLCCKKDKHDLTDCKDLKQKDVQKRWEIVRRNKVCFNCLKVGHRASQCRKKTTCGINGCTFHHHSLLHNNIKLERSKNNEIKESSENKTEHIGYQEESLDRVLLRVLPVTLLGSNGNKINTFALIDDGSTISVIERSLAEELNLDGPKIPISFSWTDGSICTEKESNTVSVKLINDEGEKFVLDNVKTLKKLQLPTQSMNIKLMKTKWPHLKEVPKQAFNRGRPRLLIGHEHVHLTVPSQVLIGPGNAPVALRSKLGWTVDGPTGKTTRNGNVNQEFIMFKKGWNTQLEDLNSMIKRNFDQDFLDSPNHTDVKGEEEVRAETIMNNTCRQTQDGRWEIGLVWKDDDLHLPESRSVAWRRLNYIENKMNSNVTMKQQYSDQMHNYAQKGYARKLITEEINRKSKKTWYLPHFSVHNPKKPNKFRFVFDAASRAHGCSLNSNLLPGPNLFNNLVDILFKFRKHQIAFAADIEEMFLRIKVRIEDQDALRFLWRGEETGKLEEWCMTSLIFGAVCSPTCAIYVIRKNADKHGEGHEEAVHAIKENFYMDDYIDSRGNTEEAIKIVKDVVSICDKGGFNLRNFLSNSPELMSTLPKEKWSKHYTEENVELSNENNVERILGLYWNFNKDQFTFRFNFIKMDKEIASLQRLPTKREVLQVVMSVYDPLGFITPVTMKGKILMQELWKINIHWDDSIPINLRTLWKNWLQNVMNAETLQIPRCYGFGGSQTIQLHVFCDASLQGYCAVAYFRIETQEQVETAFVMAKSRVAPLRATTIPRLELQAAVLGSRIALQISSIHKEINTIHFWIDSRIVWCWLQSTNKKKSVYITNRVNEILKTSDKKQWRWLPTTDNVADCATRDSSTLSNSDRWFKGPEFLRCNEEMWPKIQNQTENTEVVLVNDIQNDEKPLIDMDRFSNYSRLIRTAAWVHRFIFNIKSKINKEEQNISPSLSIKEIERGEKLCFRLSQQQSFAEDLKCLKANKTLPRESHLLKLSPILVDGLIKMKGRTEFSKDVSQDVKTPIILDPKQRLTVLLIHKEHVKSAHQGQETVANILRQKFWIIRLKLAIKSCWANCRKCQMRRLVPNPPEMAPLPSYRLEPFGRPFTCVALDYFGPLEVTVGRRREKRYGALFTCLSVRAVHLEIAASLNTDSAILALRRFAARRGCPREIISDNGTNFKAAERELREALQSFDQEQLNTFCAEMKMKWSFLPPASPHMGGVHERLVQSVKKCLYTILKSQAPREETLMTVMCEVEYIINNRPLYPVSEDPADTLPLTPNHFLLGSPNKLTPIINITENCLRKQWKIAQRYADMFWSRWKYEYIPLLNKRAKWHEHQNNVEVGDLVLITDCREPRGEWSKGIIQATYPGKDGKVRVVDVRTTAGVFRRPVLRLIKLNK